MKDNKTKEQFIKLRAEGLSYDKIAQKLKINRDTCYKWNKLYKNEVDELKADRLEQLYHQYNITKERKLETIGKTLNRIDDELSKIDFSTIQPAQLLKYKIDYINAINTEYVPVNNTPGDKITTADILHALLDLDERVKTGNTSTERAKTETSILTALLKAYEQTEIVKTLDEIQAEMEVLKDK